jgi:hypothetical protein
MNSGVRTTDRAAAGSTRGKDALGESQLPKSVTIERFQKSITLEAAAVSWRLLKWLTMPKP